MISNNEYLIEVRKWCLEKAITKSETTQDAIDEAAAYERYILTGKSAPVIEVAQLQSVFDERINAVAGVAPAKVKAVAEKIMADVRSLT